MTKSILNKAAAGSVNGFQPVRQLSTLLLLLFALVVMPLQAQESPPDSAVITQVNINTADARTLAAGLTGVGPSRAEDIVRYREAFGPFTTVEQLAEVKGVGSSTLEKNRARITLD